MYMLHGGLRFRCLDEIEVQLREIVLEFGKWLRVKFDFPVKVTVYIRNKNINNEENILASFFVPNNRHCNSYIKVYVDNHKDEDCLNDINAFRESILISIAHEVVHYTQWLEGVEFCEEDAHNKSEQLVEEFLEDREYNLTVTFTAKKLLELADLKGANKDFNEAILLYKEAIAMGCEDEFVYNYIAYYYDCIELYNESIQYYDKALKINSNNDTIYNNKGYALYCSKKYNESIENYNKSLDIEPTKETYVLKAYSEEHLREYTKAIESYDKAIYLDAHYDIAYNGKGQLLCHMGLIDEAKEACRRALSIDSDYADAYYNLSVICAKSGDFSTSINYLKTAISIDEDYIQHVKDEKVFNDYKEFFQEVLLK